VITGVDHIAIAVPDLPKAIKRFLEDFQLKYEGSEAVAAAKTHTAFFAVPATHVELIHLLNGEGPVAKYLEKRGGGLHHISLKTNDIYADVERLRELGYEFLSDQPSIGAHGSRVIFMHPKSCDGVLVELTQPAAEGTV
jgi:methylmalonyl-CoA/ethylmalonyl-CoA epimerase